MIYVLGYILSSHNSLLWHHKLIIHCYDVRGVNYHLPTVFSVRNTKHKRWFQNFLKLLWVSAVLWFLQYSSCVLMTDATQGQMPARFIFFNKTVDSASPPSASSKVPPCKSLLWDIKIQLGKVSIATVRKSIGKGKKQNDYLGTPLLPKRYSL